MDDITLIVCKNSVMKKGVHFEEANYFCQGSCDGVFAHSDDGTSVFVPLVNILVVQHGYPSKK